MQHHLTALLTLFLLTSSAVHARDDYNTYSVADAMNLSVTKEKLNRGYTYRFASQPHARVRANHGSFMSNKKTNAVGKSDEYACQWAFLSAMLSFQDRVTKVGGNAVINIRSYYKKNDFRSETEFQCGNGAIMAGVTMIGDVVALHE